MRTPEQSPKPLAAFDLDGTLFKTSMLEAVYAQACIRRYVSEDEIANLEDLRAEWADKMNSEDTYTHFVSAMVQSLLKAMTGRSAHDLDEITTFAVQEKLRTRRFVRECLGELRDTHHIIIVSASLRNISRKVLELMATEDERIPLLSGRDVHGSFWEVDAANRFTGVGKAIGKGAVVEELLHSDFVEYTGSCAFRDTIADLAMMQLVQHGVMVNPSATLVSMGGYRFHAVTESKDHIMHTLPDDGHSSLTYRTQDTRSILQRIGILASVND